MPTQESEIAKSGEKPEIILVSPDKPVAGSESDTIPTCAPDCLPYCRPYCRPNCAPARVCYPVAN